MKKTGTPYIIILLLVFQIRGFAQVASNDFEIHKLADGVYAAINKPGGRAICNAGIVDMGNETLVFDPFISPYAAQELKRVIAEMGLGPVKYVVNSHYHDDHIRGNQVFEGADIYSTQITRDSIAIVEPKEFADENEYLPGVIAKYDSLLAIAPANDAMQKKELAFWDNYFLTIQESHKILHTVLPNKIVNKTATIKGSKQSVQLIDMGMGHTTSDMIMYIPNSKIIFTGDLLFVKNHPWIADGNPDSLKACLHKMQLMNAAILVPGHGPVGNQKDLEVLENYLDHIKQTAQEEIAKGLTPEQVTELPIPEAYKSWMLSKFYLPNIRFQMALLLAQKNKTDK